MNAGFFDAAWRDTPPWDVGQPRPAPVALLDEYPPTGAVLDVGCGAGELAPALAGRGLNVLGFDLAQAAIEPACAKEAAASPEVARLVEFRASDALHASRLPGLFEALVDTGFFNLFGPPSESSLRASSPPALHRAAGIICLASPSIPPFLNAPRQVRDDELRAPFAPAQGWRLLALRLARFRTRSPRGAAASVTAHGASNGLAASVTAHGAFNDLTASVVAVGRRRA
jgi:SAM-dependent methyltransferase